MILLHLLIFYKVLAAQMVLYQPDQLLVIGLHGTAVISCVSNKRMDGSHKIFWYRRSRRLDEAPTLLGSCISGNTSTKYVCESDHLEASLKINKVQEDDSGIYYCAYQYVNQLVFANGTTLIAGDASSPSSSVHLLGPTQIPPANTSLQLACVVHGARHIVHMVWSISGRHYTGRKISMEEPGGTWSFLNQMALPRDTWELGVNVNCEVWFNSSNIRVHGQFMQKVTARVHRGFVSTCSLFLRLVVIAGILLLLVLSAHLFWTYM